MMHDLVWHYDFCIIVAWGYGMTASQHAMLFLRKPRRWHDPPWSSNVEDKQKKLVWYAPHKQSARPMMASEERKHFEVGFSRLDLRFLAFRGLSCWIPRLDSA